MLIHTARLSTVAFEMHNTKKRDFSLEWHRIFLNAPMMGAGNRERDAYLRKAFASETSGKNVRERENKSGGGVPQGPSRASLSVASPPEGWAPKQQLQTLCSFIIEDAGSAFLRVG
jgi:hypothetical protein